MYISKILLTIACICSAQASAFTCYFTVVKDSCWTEYNVSVNAIDIKTNKMVVGVSIPAQKSWARTQFECEPRQQFEYQATFDPSFWDSEKGRIYKSKGYTLLNDKINPTEIAWNLPVCFPADFSEVPFPPRGDKNCKCDFSVVTPIEKK